MSIVTFLFVGIIAGWLGSLLMEGHGLGLLGDMIVGIIGAFIGGFIFEILGIATYGFWGSVGMAAIGAAVFLFILGLVSGTRKPLGRI